jgi:hypothetical protein
LLNFSAALSKAQEIATLSARSKEQVQKGWNITLAIWRDQSTATNALGKTWWPQVNLWLSRGVQSWERWFKMNHCQNQR